MEPSKRTSARTLSQSKPAYWDDRVPDVYDISGNPDILPGRSGSGDIELRLASAKANLLISGFTSLLDAALHEALYAMNDSSIEHFRRFCDSGCLVNLLKTLHEARILSPTVQRNLGQLLRVRDISDASQVYRDDFESIRKSSVLNHSLAQQSWSPSVLESFNFGSIFSQLQVAGPNLMALLHSFVSPLDQDSSKDASGGKRRVVLTICALAHCRNDKTNFVPAMISLYLYASGVGERPMIMMNHFGLGISRRTLGRILNRMAAHARGRLRSLGPSDLPVIFVFDNLTVPATVRYARLHNNSEFLAYTAGFALVPPASRRPTRFDRKSDIRAERANEIRIDDFVPTLSDFDNICKCFQALLLQATRTCARSLEVTLPKLNDKMPVLDPIDPREAPEIQPLPTYDCNEGVINEVIEIINTIQSDVGLSESQAEEQLFLFCGDLMTVRNIREAQARQSECSPGCRLEWIEASMGLFHFMMAILGQIFKNFYGERADAWSLTRCMEALGRDPAKLWNQTNQQVKDFNMCKDFFDIVLDGCLVAMISFYFAPDSTTLANLEHHLRVASSDAKVLETMSGKLTSVFTDFHGISRLSDHLGPRSNDKASSARKRTFQNLALFVQHGMMFRTLDQAIREGDSGRISMCISYFVVWFQGTNNHNYARETMRLTACLKHIWSDELKQFWKQNCVVNLSGKAGGFVALDSVNEYLVREIKAMMGQSVTPETNERLRNVLSLLVLDFKDIKRTIADEADAEIFDFHSTPPSPWHDIRRIAPLILEGRLLASGGSEDSQLEAGDAEDRLESPPLDSYKALDLFAKGSAELGTTKAIRKLKDGIGKGDILYGLDEDEEINQLQEGEQA